MAYNFKNLNEVPVQEKPTKNTAVMAFESGQPKQIPASEFGGKGLVVDLRGYTISSGGEPFTIEDMNYDPIYEAITAGQNVVLHLQIAEGLSAFMTVMLAGVLPGSGFRVDTFDYTILFTNGSYHTTA